VRDNGTIARQAAATVPILSTVKDKTALTTGQLHKALELSNGKYSDAAKLLGVTTDDLKTRVHGSPELKRRWAHKKGEKEAAAPSEGVAINRPLSVVRVPDNPEGLLSPEEMAKLLEKEDKLVREGLEAIGLRGEAQQLAVALHKFHGAHYKTSLEMLGGGMTKLYFDLYAEWKDITEKLRTSTDLNEQLILRKDRATITEAMQRVFDRATKAALTAAVVKFKTQGNTEPGMKPAKPGWEPAIAVKSSDDPPE
jgi:hypothetical protein